MADPLSVIAGVAGVSIACAQLANATFTLCDKTRHAPNDLREIGSNMSLLSSILDSLAGVLEKGQNMCKPRLLSDTSTIILRLKIVRKEVNAMIKSKPGLRGRLNWALFDHGKTMEILQRIEAMKTALMLVLATIQLAMAQEGREDRAKQVRLSTLVACAVRDSRQCVIQQSHYAQWAPLSHADPTSPTTNNTPATVDYFGDQGPLTPKGSSPNTSLPPLSNLPYTVPVATNTANPKAATVPALKRPVHNISPRKAEWGREPSKDPKAVSSSHISQPYIVPAFPPSSLSPTQEAYETPSPLPPPGPMLPYGQYSTSPEFFKNMEESSSWLYHLVFESEKIPLPEATVKEPKPDHGANMADQSGRSIQEQTKSHMTVKVGNTATDSQIMSRPPSVEYLYGLSVRNTVENLVQAWTYIKLSELPLRLVLPEEASTEKSGVQTQKGQNQRHLDQSKRDNNIYYYSTDENSWSGPSDVSVSDTSSSDEGVTIEIGKPRKLDKQKRRTREVPQAPQIRAHAPQHTLDYDSDSRSASTPRPARNEKRQRNQSAFDGHLDFNSPRPSDQAAENQTLQTLLEKLEVCFRNFGEDAKKAEKARQEIEAFKKKEQDARFTRLENMISTQIDNWKVEQKNHHKAREEATRQAAKVRKEEDERIRKLEEAFLAASLRADTAVGIDEGIKMRGVPVDVGKKRGPPPIPPPPPPPIPSFPGPPPPPPSIIYNVKSGSSTSSRRKSQRSDWLWGQPKSRKRRSRTARSEEREARR